nr:hypothetical protein [Thauera propionica]
MRNSIDQVGDLLLDCGQLAGLRAHQVVGLGACLGESGADLGLDAGQLLAAGELGADVAQQARVDRHTPRQHSTAHGGAAVLALGAAVVTAAGGDDGATALTTAQQASEQGRWALALAAAAGFARGAAEACAHRIPQRLVEDAQLGVVFDDPFFPRAIEPRALAGVGVLHPLRAVPDHAADVQLVVEHAAALGRAAVQGRYRPSAAAAGLDAAGVEVGGDALAAPPVAVALVDLAHRGRLGWLDLEHMDVAHGHRSIAEGHAAGVATALQLAREAAVRLVAQVVEVDLVDEAAHCAVDLAAAALGVVAVGHTDDADAAVLEATHHALLLDHVAAQAVEAFDQQHRKAAGQRVGHQACAFGPARHGRAARYAVVGVGAENGKPERVGSGLAHARLVSEGCLALAVGAVAGVDGCGHVAESGWR